MGSWRRGCYSEVLPFTAIITLECATVGLNTLFKAASLQGLSYYVFISYIYTINTLILLPIAFFFSRKHCNKAKLPSSKFSVFWRICLLGSLGVSAHITGFKGVQYSNPTLSSSTDNLTLAFTFILAIIFRMEKPDLRSSSFQAKLIGTIVSISGALLVVLYKGPAIFPITSPISPNSSSLLWSSVQSSQSNWVLGGLFLIVECLLFSLWFIVMTDTMRIYQAELVVSFFYCFTVAILSTAVGFVAEPNLTAWRPSSNTALMAFIYSGCFGPAFQTVVQSWTLNLKGPVFVAIFKPLSIVIAVITGVIFLGDSLHLGSAIGALILSIGVYAVIWGIANDEHVTEQCVSATLTNSSDDNKLPLLDKEDV